MFEFATVILICLAARPRNVGRNQAAGVYHQVKSEIDIHVNYGSGCPNIVRCYGYFYDEKRYTGPHDWYYCLFRTLAVASFWFYV